MDIKYKEDILHFLDVYEKSHPAPYYFCTKDYILDYIEEYGKGVVDELDFQYMMRSMIKMLNGRLDPHTGIRFKKNKYLPILMKMFNEELCIIKTSNNYENILWSKVHKINNIPIKQIMKEIENCYSYNTEGWKKHGIVRIVRDIDGILMLPSVDNNCKEIVFECLDENNQTTIVSFNVNEVYECNFKEENYQCYIHDNIIVFKYSLCLEDYEGQMKDCVNQIEKYVDEYHINKLILDIRNNIGGNSFLIDILIEYLKSKDMKIVVLTNGEVFSSGIDVIQKIRCFDTIFVGEEVGSTINHFGALDCQFYLPNTGIKCVVSTKYIGLKNVAVSQDDFKKLNESDLEESIFKPDILVKELLNDLKKENDTILETAIQYLKV